METELVHIKNITLPYKHKLILLVLMFPVIFLPVFCPISIPMKYLPKHMSRHIIFLPSN